MKTRILTLTALCLLLAGAVGSGPFAPPASAQTRAIRVIAAAAAAGGEVGVAIELTAQGNENAVGFSLNFNQAILSNPRAALGAGAAGATINANANQAAQGRVGVAVALPSGQVFAAGARQLAVVTFTVASAAAAGATPIAFGDQPVAREVASATASILPADFVPGAVTVAGAVANVSAASFTGAMLAPDSIVAAFGAKLATATRIADTQPLPTTLVGTTVRVKDSAGTERPSSLFFVSAGQINHLLPAGAANGAATVTVTSGDGSISIGAILLAAVAPGLFAANANGQGVAAAVALRARGTVQTFEPVARLDQAQSRFVPEPIDLGPAGDQVFLILYGTGARNRSALSAVTCKVGGADVTVSFVGAAEGFAGLDQLNVGPLPNSLRGRGEVDVALIADGKPANIVRVSIR
ncbi:MAG: hypothetical protein ACREAM_01395 [Blastocatellia bacterium]